MLVRIKNKLRIFRSLKLRIFFIILVAGIVPSLIIRYAIMENYVDRALEVKVSDVQTQVRIIANHLLTYHYLEDSSSEVINAELNQLSNLYDGRVLIMNEDFLVIKDTYEISEGKTMISEEVIKCFKGQSTTYYDEEYQYVEMTVPIMTSTIVSNADGVEAEESVCKGVMLVSVSTDSIAITLEILNRKTQIVVGVMYIFIVAVAIGLSYLLIRPFNHITQAIAAVKGGFTDEEISVPDYLETEIGRASCRERV